MEAKKSEHFRASEECFLNCYAWECMSCKFFSATVSVIISTNNNDN